MELINGEVWDGRFAARELWRTGFIRASRTSNAFVLRLVRQLFKFSGCDQIYLEGTTTQQVTLSTTAKLGGTLEARELETSKLGEVTQVETSPVETFLLLLLTSDRCVTRACERLNTTPVVLSRLVVIL